VVNKHEYFHGTVRATVEARPAHNRLCFNLNVVLGAQLAGNSCTGYTSDHRVLNANSYLYPDMTVACGEAEFSDEQTPENLLNPTFIVEVISESTANRDRGEKFMRLPAYNNI